MDYLFSSSPASKGNRLDRYTRWTTNFVVGDCNRFAYQAAQLFSHPYFPYYYNPLLIIGSNGSGKSHLLGDIYKRFCRTMKSHRMKVNYITGLNFSREYVNAIRKNALDLLRKKYMECDVLLLDDIHTLAAKKASQYEFAYLFDTLNERGKKVCITTAYPLKSNKDWDERLISRLKNGLNVRLTPADYQIRLDILKLLQMQHRCKIESSILELIARRVDTNLHDLIETAEKTFAYTHPSRNIVEKMIQDVINPVRKSINSNDSKVTVLNYNIMNLSNGAN
jgi:chromosomal replication initiator protein